MKMFVPISRRVLRGSLQRLVSIGCGSGVGPRGVKPWSSNEAAGAPVGLFSHARTLGFSTLRVSLPDAPKSSSSKQLLHQASLLSQPDDTASNEDPSFRPKIPSQQQVVPLSDAVCCCYILLPDGDIPQSTSAYRFDELA